jgi:hypothetical protein
LFCHAQSSFALGPPWLPSRRAFFGASLAPREAGWTARGRDPRNPARIRELHSAPRIPTSDGSVAAVKDLAASDRRLSALLSLFA